MSSGIRRQARAYALQVLYAADVAEAGELSDDAARTWEALELDLPEPKETQLEPARTDLEPARTELEPRLERMSRVDRNILRLAVAELTGSPEVPSKVVINEAVELAKVFGAEESPAFVNGILDRVAQDVRGK